MRKSAQTQTVFARRKRQHLEQRARSVWQTHLDLDLVRAVRIIEKRAITETGFRFDLAEKKLRLRIPQQKRHS